MLPSPNAIKAITAAAPMMMPSTERQERSLCASKLRAAVHRLCRPLALANQGLSASTGERAINAIDSMSWNMV